MFTTAKWNKSTDYKTEMKNHSKKQSEIKPLSFKNLVLILDRGTKSILNFWELRNSKSGKYSHFLMLPFNNDNKY